MKLTVKQIMFILMCTLLVLVVVMGAIVLSRLGGLFQLSAGPALNGTGSTPVSSDIPPESSVVSSPSGQPLETTVPHEHEYVKAKTVSASCDNYGYTLYECACGESDIQDFKDPLGHNYGDYTVVAATCTTDGWTERTCSRCKNIEHTKPTTASHKFGVWMDIDVEEGEPTQEMRTCSSCKMLEIRSLDTLKTWVLRRTTLDPYEVYTHYQIVVDLADSDTDPTYEIYTGLSNKEIYYDYDENGLTIFYTVADVPMAHTAPASGTNVLTIYADGTVSTSAPVENPEPTPSTGPSNNASEPTTQPSTGTSEPTTQPSTEPDVSGATGPSTPETTGPADGQE